MQRSSMIRSLVLVGALAISIPAFAKPVSKSLPLNRDSHFGQTDLKAGDYTMLIDGDHLTIKSGKNVVAEANGHWEDRTKKADYTEIFYDNNGNVLELRFAGQKNAFVLAK